MNAKLDEAMVHRLALYYNSGQWTVNELAVMLALTRQACGRIIRGKAWKNCGAYFDHEQHRRRLRERRKALGQPLRCQSN